MSSTVGPKISVVDSISDGSTYGDVGRAFLRMYQALIMPNVINMTTSVPPSTPANGDMYVVASPGSGAWVGKTNYVTYWTTDDPNHVSGVWEFYLPIKGWIVVNQFDNTQYEYNGSTWGAISSGLTSATLPSMGVSFVYCDGSGTNPVGTSIEGIQTVSNVATPHVAGGVSGEGTCIVYQGDPNANPSTVCTWRAGLDVTVNVNVRSTLISARRYTFKQAMGAPASYRYWIGVYTATTTLGGALFATNTPNTGYVAFRFCQGTDTTWKAVAGTSNVLQTVVDTGVSFVSSPSTTFNIVPNSTGTSVDYYINGANVATIATNLPGGNTPVAIFGTGDNKNAASTPSITFCYATIEYK